MADFIGWKDFVESKSNNSMYKPPQGDGANPYMPTGKHDGGKLRVAKDNEKKEPFGSMGGSNVTPADSSLGMPGGKGGVGITETKKGPKTPYPGGKVDGRIRVTKDKEGGKEWGDLRTPGIDASTSTLGKEAEKGAGTTTEDIDDLSTAEYIEFVLKKKDDLDESAIIMSKSGDCDLDDDFVDDFTGRKVYVSIPKILKRAAKAMVAQSDRWPRVFIRELKRMGDGMPVLVNELTSHSEAFDEFAGHIRTNENKSAKKLVKSMNQHYLDYLTELGMMESVSPPMDTRLQPEPDNDYPAATDEAFPGQSMPGMAGPSMAGPTSAMGAMGGGMGPTGGGGAMGGGPTGGMGGGAMGGGPTGGMGGGAMGGGGTSLAGGPASPNPGEQPGAMNFPGTESRKEFGYHHLIKEMGNYDNMKNAMVEYLDI